MPGGMIDWNGVRFRHGTRRGHVESYFLKLNQPGGQRALWLKATILSKLGAEPVAEAWAVAFERGRLPVGTKQVVPYANARFSTDRLDLQVGESVFREGHVEGVVASNGHRIEYALRFTTDEPPLLAFASPKMYETKLPRQKLVSPHPSSRFTGTYRIDGQELCVDAWPGMQGHNWGPRHTELYAWSHCNDWDDAEDLVFEGATARIKVGPVLTPPLTWAVVVHRGVRYELNGPRTLLRARGKIEGCRRWQFAAEGRQASVNGEISGQISDFAGLYYENPNGAMTYCLNSKLAEARIRLRIRGRPEILATTRSAALEIGTKDPRHGVTMLV